MANFDLIPQEYRHERWLRAWARQIGVVAVIVIAFGTVASVVLARQVSGVQEQAKILEEQREVTAQQQAELEMLGRQESSLSRQLAMLAGLRSGAPAEALFVTIDRALAQTEVWFLNWQFQRAGVLVPEEDAATVETGYFIVVPEGKKVRSGNEWTVETHMTISGQAQDHDALSRFVQGLFKQNVVVDVRVQKTALSRQANADVVDFDLAVVLNSDTQS